MQSSGKTLQKRICGIETEYGVTFTYQGQRRLSPDEIARYLFRKIVTWGRSSNVFLTNGSRLYLDVGSHPEYATAECDSLEDLIAQDKAGDRILEELLNETQERLAHDNIEGKIYLFKNNTDSTGNSYGCHENFLVSRVGEFSRITDVLLPFLITRQLICGAGKVVPGAHEGNFCLSQRAEHMWEGVSSATTRSRPIINTRDEPHADAEKYRRLHVIVGDSNMSETTTLLKVGTMSLLLEMLEASIPFKDFSLDNPIRAIREVSDDITGRKPVRLAGGRTASALDIQTDYYQRAKKYISQHQTFPIYDRVVQLWGRTLEAIETHNLSLIDKDIDWAIKYKLIQRYQEKYSWDLSHPKIAQLDLAYHDIKRGRGIFDVLQSKGLINRVIDDARIEHAVSHPPSTTRAALRGRFVKAAQEANRDYTVDWVHLKLNDRAQQTVLCKDPFRSVDERVDRIIASFSE